MFRKISSLIALVALLALAGTTPAGAAVSAGNTGWQWSNPQPQGNGLSTVDFTGARGYAAGAAGTLLRSDDQGASWSSLRSGLVEPIKLIRATSADSFVFTTGCALRRSDDGGATVSRLSWTSNDFSCAVEIASFDFPTASAGYLLLSNGNVYVTGDGGRSWSLGTALPGTAASGGSAQPGDIRFTSASEGVATAGNTVYRTANGGSSWTLVDSSANGQLRRIVWSSALDGMVFGSSTKPLVTADGGLTYTQVPTAPGAELYDADCANATTCVAAAKDGLSLRRTDDGGAVWTTIAPAGEPLWGLAFASATRAIAIGNGGTTVVSNDAGATWASVNASVAGAFKRLTVRSASVAFMYGLGGAIARTADGGTSWTRFNLLTAGDVVSLSFVTADEGYALDSNGQLLRTANGGASWQVLDTGTTARPSAVHAPDARNVMLAGPKGIRHSDDGGASFNAISDRRVKRAALNQFDEAGSAIFAYGSRGVYRSTDKGKRWRPVNGPRRRTIESLDFVSAKSGFVLDGAGELWATRNGGRKWAMLTGFGHNDRSSGDLTTMAWGDAKTGYVSGPDQPIVATNDGGKTWTEQTPFALGDGDNETVLGSAGSKNAFALRAWTASIVATATGGRAGVPSALKLKPTKRRVRRGSNLKVGGSLAGATGGEQVTIATRPANAKPGTAWKYQRAIVSATGSFTTVWKVKQASVFVAWWDGDARREGDGAAPVTVKTR